MEFKDGKFTSAEDKSMIFKAYKRFVESGFKEAHFPERLYKYLSLNFSFIAHFNRDGFFSVRFLDPRGRKETFDMISGASQWNFNKENADCYDLNKAVYDWTLGNQDSFLVSAKAGRIAELEEDIKQRQAELSRLKSGR